jgi:AAA ATPase-like protein
LIVREPGLHKPVLAGMISLFAIGIVAPKATFMPMDVSWPGVVFVGRSAELEELRDALTEALGGSSRAVLISGEPGIGKSALTGRLAREAEALGVPVAWGRGSEREGVPVFWPWIQILRDQLRRSDPADRKRLERSAAPLYRMMPQLRRPEERGADRSIHRRREGR